LHKNILANNTRYKDDGSHSQKIVFVQPRWIQAWGAIGVGYIISYLRRYGYNNIMFYSGFFDSDSEIIRGCEDADIIGFSCTSGQIKSGLELAKKVKKPSNCIVMGGVHPSALPYDVLMNSCVDIVVIGEGERAFLDIVRGNRNSIVQRPYIKDIDSIPFPDRKTVREERYINLESKHHGMRAATIISGRGCPFRCVFCASHVVWSRKCRLRSPKNILDEFEQVINNWKVDFIKFSDDTFTINKRRVLKFCKEKIKCGINTKWGCNMRVDTIDEDMLSVMHKAGCTDVWLGVESGSPKILKDMKKGINIEQIKWAFKKTAELGFRRRAYFLLGMPEETIDDIKMTEQLADEIDADENIFTILTPYPGSELYDNNKHVNIDWSLIDSYENYVMHTNFLDNKTLHLEQIRLVEKYNSR